MATKLRGQAGYSKKTKAGKKRRKVLHSLMTTGNKPAYPRQTFRGKAGRAKYKSMAGNVKKVFG